MATRTSTQSGNFNSTTTWGGNPVPVDGDSFVVANGHIVTINDDRRVTNGFADSYINGKLHVVNGGKFRMNGILYIDNNGNHLAYFAEGNASTAGFLRMDPGSICEIKGTLADQHSIRMTAKGYTTMEIIGTNPNPQTTLTADANNNDSSLTVADASDFAIGDWITVYKEERSAKNYAYYKSDEGMWIHDIEMITTGPSAGNYLIYPRKFVGPETTIISVSGSNIIVSDASVMRVGYQIIFGTGNNRNIKTISSINYVTNTIVVDSSVSGSVIGESVYRTGLDKGHLSGDNVLRIAAVLTADADQSTNTIVVNNTNGFSVGDLILITMNDPSYSNASSWDLVMDYTITDINTSTKTITITAGYANPTITTLHKNFKAGVGGLVVNLTRDTKFAPPEGTTYGTNNVGFIYWDYFNISNMNYYRRIKVKNVEISAGASNQNSYFGAIGGRGHNSYDLVTYGGYTMELDGNVVYTTYRTGNNFGNFWEYHQCNFRNNVSYNAANQGWGGYGNHRGIFNNIAARNGGNTYQEGFYGQYNDHGYNYMIRSGSGFYISQWYEPTNRFHDNYSLFAFSRVLNRSYDQCVPYIFNCYFDYFVVWGDNTRTNLTLYNHCYFGNKWDVTDFQTGGIYQDSVNLPDGTEDRLERRSATTNLSIVHNYNFKYNQSLIWNRRALRIYDNNESSWRVYPDRDQSGYMGFSNDILIPANTRIFIKGVVKTVSGNTNYPYIFIRNYVDGAYGLVDTNLNTYLDILNAAHVPYITPVTGFLSTSAFSSSSNTWEEKNITVPALPFDYYITIGIGCSGSSGNSRLGWWEKDLEIAIENSYGFNEARHLINNLTTRLPVQVKSTSNQLKTILGG